MSGGAVPALAFALALGLLVAGCSGAAGGEDAGLDAGPASDAIMADGQGLDAPADATGSDDLAVDVSGAGTDDGAGDGDGGTGLQDGGGRDADGASDPDGSSSSSDAAMLGRPAYVHLAETGLYADGATHTLASSVMAFEPTHKLWSDGASKRRWIELPPGTQIDTSDMDHWVFPVGTKLWKEFARDGVLLETRLVQRYGTGPDDYWMGAFAWNADQTDAVFVEGGALGVLGTDHDIPPTKDCGACHRGDVGRVLGFSAIQLSRPAGTNGPAPTLRTLADAGLLTSPPPEGVDYPVPGDGTTAAALGYLHANCGHCHNERGTSWPDTQMVLRLEVAERDVATSKLVKTTFRQPLQYWRGGDITLRVAPGHAEASAVVARMNRRGKDQMPSLATKVIDAAGLGLVQAWIAASADR